MATLVSPGTSVSIIDESQYISGAIGTIPFVLVASAENKLYNNTIAPYTTAAYAGQLLSLTSQRDLVTNFGFPTFQTSSAGTPLHGNELNEYGLMAAYSALGVVNQMYVMRANIDLNELKGTAIRPIGDPANGTQWLDTTDSTWGIFEWDAVNQVFNNKTPIAISSVSELQPNTSPQTPNIGLGSLGSYAVVATSSFNYVFYKFIDPMLNVPVWAQVGTTEWQRAWPTVVSVPPTSTVTLSVSTFTINGFTITTSTSISSVVNAINTANAIANPTQPNVPGVYATYSGNTVTLYADSTAMSNGVIADGLISLTEIDPVNTPLKKMGFVSGTTTNVKFASPALNINGYVQVPAWQSSNTLQAMPTSAMGPRPSGSVWAKTTSVGGGANILINGYNATTNAWVPEAAPVYTSESGALYALDPLKGGANIPAGTLFVLSDALRNGTLTYRPFVRTMAGATNVTGSVSTLTNASTGSFTISATVPGNASLVQYPAVNVAAIGTAQPNSPTPAQNFVSAILAANIPYVTASASASGAITITHTAGGTITLQDSALNGILTAAGFTSSTVNGNIIPTAGSPLLILSNFAPLMYTYSASAPYIAPQDGTLWYFDSPLDVDIMINDGTAWRGYHNVTSDARGYNLSLTDANGVIFAPIAPVTQSNGTSPLASGDLWINTGDLENFPVISRWNGASWILINNSDNVDQNGIVFADARWDGAGLANPAIDAMPTIASLLTSDYVDLDAPDYRLYARGTLLFNLRRSGYNIKHYVNNYFNASAFQPNAYSLSTSYSIGSKVMLGSVLYASMTNNNMGNNPETTVGTSWSVIEPSTWVTSSGLMNSGAPYTGSAAQRQMVIQALSAAISASQQLRESMYTFNLIACPNYPELIPEMVSLNNDRLNTAFIIGDSPMTMPANAMTLNQWSNDTNGNGLAVADPYYAVYYPSGLSTDLSGNTIAVPPSHMILRAALKSDNASYPWFAYAGTRRGLIDNATDIGYIDPNSGAWVHDGINQGMRDAMYPLNINPITFLPGTGIMNFGNLTRSGTTSSLDRVTTARLVNYIRAALDNIGTGFLFEPNDTVTRNQFKNLINSFFNDLVTKRGIYSYLVVCDESNNPPEIIAQNQMYCDVAIEPMKDVEFIYIPIRLMNTGALEANPS